MKTPRTSSTNRPSRPKLSTGSTLLNLECSGSPGWGFRGGGYYHIVGDSSSGKTFIALTCMAEAVLNEAFAGYRLIYDDAENGVGFDFDRFWPVLKDRIEPPRGTRDEPVYSTTVEDFYDALDDAYKAGSPFVYVLDSMDVLVPRADEQKYQKQKRTRRRQQEKPDVKDEAGSMGTAKAKLNSEHLRKAMAKLKASNSILVIVSQTRDKVGGMPGYGDNKVLSGGHALKFYATNQLWCSVKEQIKSAPINGRERRLGIKTQVRIRKNRQIGGDRRCVVPIYHRTGIDDTGSLVDYLVEEKWWSKGGGGIDAREFDQKLPREKLVQHVEAQKGGLKLLKSLAHKVWREIEEKCTIARKSRYGL